MSWPMFSHAGEPFGPNNLWTAWDVSPWVWVPLGLTIFIYLWGLHNVWRRAGAGRGITLRRGAGFLGAILALVVALLSPLDALSAVLFSAHMIQHLVLMLAAAPLLVLSDFPLALLWALPRAWSQLLSQSLKQSRLFSRAWQGFTEPLSAWMLFAVALWLWHTPLFYEAALRDETIHTWEHSVFLLTAMLFWWALFRHSGLNHYRYGMAVPYLFTTALHSGILGALMTFSAQPWYPYYMDLVIPWGLTPLQDQQLAGLIMWLPGGAVFTLLTIGYFAAWLRALERRSVRLQQRKTLRARQG